MNWPLTARNVRPRRENPRRPLRCELLEPRQLLSGVTLITHGFNSSVDDWVTAMADAMAARPDLTIDQPRYRVEVTDPGHDGGPLSVVNTSRSGPALTDCTDPEIVILLNWSDVAGTLSLGGGYHRSTVDVAAAVAAKLVSPNFLTGLATPVAELPFHLIGHSRGASLVDELAKDLGQYGVWMDQVTTLDPHPVDGVREPWLFNYNFGDAPMTGWKNVTFWDNYWRTEGSSAIDFTGESINNVYNLQLSESVLSNGGYSTEHSDVHLWYHGTIDTSPTANDGAYTVPTSWYGGTQPARDVTGFYYSRLVDGARTSAGLSAELGGAANRTTINWSAAQWPNVLQLAVGGGNLQFTSGDPVPLSYYYHDYGSAATISYSLDPDRNPYNQNNVVREQLGVAQTGSAPVPASALLSTAGVTVGTYYVAAKISDPSGLARYAYTTDPITIVGAVGCDVTWTGAVGATWSTAAASGNWATTSGGTPADYADGVNVTFNDSATGTTVDISAADVSPASVLFNNSSKNFTIAGLYGIAGAATTVTKQGTGTVTLSTANTYGGPTTIEAGKLVLQSTAKAMAPVLTAGGADIKGGMLVLDYAGEADPAATVKSLLTASYDAAGTSRFDTGKFRSSTADATHGLGWIDNTATSKISIAYTIYGDADLDGSVGISDLGKVLTNWGTGNRWQDGDFDYNGSVGLSDLGKVLTNWGLSVGSLTPAAVIDTLFGQWVIHTDAETPRQFGLPAARATANLLPSQSEGGLMKMGTGSATGCTVARSSPLLVAVPVPVFIRHKVAASAATVRHETLSSAANRLDGPASRAASDAVLRSEDPEVLQYFDSQLHLDWLEALDTSAPRRTIDVVLVDADE